MFYTFTLLFYHKSNVFFLSVVNYNNPSVFHGLGDTESYVFHGHDLDL